MGGTIFEAAAFGAGVTLSPLAVVAVVLTLAGPAGRRGALAFVASWIGALTIGSSVALLLADVIGPGREDDPASWLIAGQFALALLLVGVALRQWLRRGNGEGSGEELPAWMRKVDGLTPSRAAGFALLLALGKPKNLLLTIGVALAIAELDTSATEQAAGIVIFALVATAAPAAPLVVSVLMRERGPAILERLRIWMIREEALIVAGLCLLFAAKLFANAAGAA